MNDVGTKCEYGIDVKDVMIGDDFVVIKRKIELGDEKSVSKMNSKFEVIIALGGVQMMFKMCNHIVLKPCLSYNLSW